MLNPSKSRKSPSNSIKIDRNQGIRKTSLLQKLSQSQLHLGILPLQVFQLLLRTLQLALEQDLRHRRHVTSHNISISNGIYDEMRSFLSKRTKNIEIVTNLSHIDSFCIDILTDIYRTYAVYTSFQCLI